MDDDQVGPDEYFEEDEGADSDQDWENRSQSSAAMKASGEFIAANALPLAAAFVAGLLLGWVALGWWLFPVEWTDALPADLRADARAEYVRMVADLHVRENDEELSRRRLRSFEGAEGDLAAVGPIITSISSARDVDPIASQNVQRLASDLRIVLRPAAGVEAGVEEGVGEGGDGGSGDVASDAATAEAAGGWLRSLAVGVLIAGAGAGAALMWAWASWRGEPAPGGGPRRQVRGAVLSRDQIHPFSAEDLALEDPDPGPKARAGRGSALERDSTQRRGRSDNRSLQRAERRGLTGAWSSSPTRIALGETKSIDYEASEEPFRWSWLVHDELDRVAATVEIKERRIGAVNALELAFYETLGGDGDGSGAGSERNANVSIVARSAADNFLLANDLLKDRVMAPAIPGDVVTLSTAEFAVDIEIRGVTPDPSVSDVMELRSLTLALTPTRRLDDGGERSSRLRFD